MSALRPTSKEKKNLLPYRGLRPCSQRLDSDLFKDQFVISKTPSSIVNSTSTLPAIQESRPHSIIHVPRHHIIHYSPSSNSVLSPTPRNSPGGCDRHRQASLESRSSRHCMSDQPRPQHSPRHPAPNSQHLNPFPFHQTSASNWTVTRLQGVLKERKIIFQRTDNKARLFQLFMSLHFCHRSNRCTLSNLSTPPTLPLH